MVYFGPSQFRETTLTHTQVFVQSLNVENLQSGNTANTPIKVLSGMPYD